MLATIHVGYVMVSVAGMVLLPILISLCGNRVPTESCQPFSIDVDPFLPTMSREEFKAFEESYKKLEEFTERVYRTLQRGDDPVVFADASYRAEADAARSSLSTEIHRWRECSNTDSTCSRCLVPTCTQSTRHAPIPSNISYGNLTRSCNVHGFVLSVHEAYRRHLPLTIRAEDIWLLILQGVAMHLLMVPIEVRMRLEDHWKIRPTNQPHIIPINNTDEMIERLVRSFQRELNYDSSSTRSILRPFSGSTLLQEVSFGAAAFSHEPFNQLFPNYKGHHQCGIPIIRLGGTHYDWIDLLDRMKSLHMGELDPQLRFWESGLTWILSSIIDSIESIDGTKSDENISPSINTFWQGMYQLDERLEQLEEWGYCDGEFIEFGGWLTFFFPYLHGFELMDSIGVTYVNHNIIHQGDNYSPHHGNDIFFESNIFQVCLSLFVGGRLLSEDISKCFAKILRRDLPSGISQTHIQLIKIIGVDEDEEGDANGIFYVGFGDPRISYDLCDGPQPLFPFNIFSHSTPKLTDKFSGVYSTLAWGYQEKKSIQPNPAMANRRST